MKNQENKLFKPDFDKPLFTIKIEVLDNCARIGIVADGEYKPTYQEVIGALEAQKISLIFQQREVNIKASKKSTETLQKETVKKIIKPLKK